MPLSQLKIKTNVVKRINKERASYLKEADTQGDRIKKLQNEGADEADIRKQREVLDETLQMIPDVSKRLHAAIEDLQNQVANSENADPEELKEANSVLDEIAASG